MIIRTEKIAPAIAAPGGGARAVLLTCLRAIHDMSAFRRFSAPRLRATGAPWRPREALEAKRAFECGSRCDRNTIKLGIRQRMKV